MEGKQILETSPLAARIYSIMRGEVKIITLSMLERVGISRNEAIVAIGQLKEAKLCQDAKGGFRAL